MPSPPVLTIVVPLYPLTEFLFERLRERTDLRVIAHPLPPRRRLGGLLRALEVYPLAAWKGSRFFDRAYTAQLASIRPEDPVLYFAIENRKDLQIVRKFVRARTQSVWLWNPIDNTRGGALSRGWYRTWLHRSGMAAYTFDPADARRYGIGLLPQVWRRLPAEATRGAPRHDVYFLGIDKGRLAQLQSLRAAFEEAGLTTNFRIFADKRRHYSEADRAELTTEWLPYRESLRGVHDARAVLELLQSSQSGPTLRSMEAAFLGRKLITDNVALRHTDLYHPSRIFLLGEDDLAGLRAFMERPLEPLPAATLDAHDIAHWLMRFGAPAPD